MVKVKYVLSIFFFNFFYRWDIGWEFKRKNYVLEASSFFLN